MINDFFQNDKFPIPNICNSLDDQRLQNGMNRKFDAILQRVIFKMRKQ